MSTPPPDNTHSASGLPQPSIDASDNIDLSESSQQVPNTDASLYDVLQPEKLAALIQQIAESVNGDTAANDRFSSSQSLNIDSSILSEQILQSLNNSYDDDDSSRPISHTTIQDSGSLLGPINNDSSQNVPKTLPPPSPPPPHRTSSSPVLATQQQVPDSVNQQSFILDSSQSDQNAEMSEFEIEQLLESVSAFTEQIQSQTDTDGNSGGPQEININALLDQLDAGAADIPLTEEDMETLKFVQNQIYSTKDSFADSSQTQPSQSLEPPHPRPNRRISIERRPSSNIGLSGITEFSQRIKRASMSRRRFSDDAFLNQLKQVIAREPDYQPDTAIIEEDESEVMVISPEQQPSNQPSSIPDTNSSQQEPLSESQNDDETLNPDFQQMLLNALQIAMDNSGDVEDTHEISDSISNQFDVVTKENEFNFNPENHSIPKSSDIAVHNAQNSLLNTPAPTDFPAHNTVNDLHMESSFNNIRSRINTHTDNNDIQLRSTQTHTTQQYNDEVSALNMNFRHDEEYNEAEIEESLKSLQGLFQANLNDAIEDDKTPATHFHKLDSPLVTSTEHETADDQSQDIIAQLASLLQSTGGDSQMTDEQEDKSTTQDKVEDVIMDNVEDQNEKEKISDIELALAEAISKSLMDQLNLPQSDDESESVSVSSPPPAPVTIPSVQSTVSSTSQDISHQISAKQSLPSRTAPQGSRPYQTPSQIPSRHQLRGEVVEPTVDYEILLNALQQAIEEVSGTTAAAVASEAAANRARSTSVPSSSQSSQSHIKAQSHSFSLESEEDGNADMFLVSKPKSSSYISASSSQSAANRRVSLSQDDAFSSADIEAALSSLFKPDGTLQISMDESEADPSHRPQPESQPENASEEDIALQSTASMVEALLQSGAISLEQLAALNRPVDEPETASHSQEALKISETKQSSIIQKKKTRPRKQTKLRIKTPEASTPAPVSKRTSTTTEGFQQQTQPHTTTIPATTSSIPAIASSSKPTSSVSVRPSTSPKQKTPPATGAPPSASSSSLASTQKPASHELKEKLIQKPRTSSNSSMSIAETLAIARANMRLRPSSSENKIDPMLARREIGLAALRARNNSANSQSASSSRSDSSADDRRTYYHSFVRNTVAGLQGSNTNSSNQGSSNSDTLPQYTIYTPQSGPLTAASNSMSARASATNAVNTIAANAASRLFNSNILANATRAVAASRSSAANTGSNTPSIASSSEEPGESSDSTSPAAKARATGARTKFFYYTPPPANAKKSDKPAPAFSTIPAFTSSSKYPGPVDLSGARNNAAINATLNAANFSPSSALAAVAANVAAASNKDAGSSSTAVGRQPGDLARSILNSVAMSASADSGNREGTNIDGSSRATTTTSEAEEEGEKGVAANVMAALLLARSVVNQRNDAEHSKDDENAEKSKTDSDGDTDMGDAFDNDAQDDSQDTRKLSDVSGVDSSTMEAIQEAIQAMLAEEDGTKAPAQPSEQNQTRVEPIIPGNKDPVSGPNVAVIPSASSRSATVEPNNATDVTGDKSTTSSPDTTVDRATVSSRRGRGRPRASRGGRGGLRTRGGRLGSTSSQSGSDQPHVPTPEEILFPRPNLEGLSDKERARVESRLRKKIWRYKNVDRNRDNDLRVRVVRRAAKLFGPESTPEKEKWIENEFITRRNKRIDKTANRQSFERNASVPVATLTSVTTIGISGQPQKMQVMVPTTNRHSFMNQATSMIGNNRTTSITMVNPTSSGVLSFKATSSNPATNTQLINQKSPVIDKSVGNKVGSKVNDASAVSTSRKSDGSKVDEVMDSTRNTNDTNIVGSERQDGKNDSGNFKNNTSISYESNRLASNSIEASKMSPNKRKRSPSLDLLSSRPAIGPTSARNKNGSPSTALAKPLAGPPSTLSVFPNTSVAPTSLSNNFNTFGKHSGNSFNKFAKNGQDIYAPRANLIGSLTPTQVQSLTFNIPKPLPFVAAKDTNNGSTSSSNTKTDNDNNTCPKTLSVGPPSVVSSKPTFLSRFPRFNLNAGRFNTPKLPSTFPGPSDILSNNNNSTRDSNSNSTDNKNNNNNNNFSNPLGTTRPPKVIGSVPLTSTANSNPSTSSFSNDKKNEVSHSHTSQPTKENDDFFSGNKNEGGESSASNTDNVLPKNNDDPVASGNGTEAGDNISKNSDNNGDDKNNNCDSNEDDKSMQDNGITMLEKPLELQPSQSSSFSAKGGSSATSTGFFKTPSLLNPKFSTLAGATEDSSSAPLAARVSSLSLSPSPSPLLPTDTDKVKSTIPAQHDAAKPETCNSETFSKSALSTSDLDTDSKDEKCNDSNNDKEAGDSNEICEDKEMKDVESENDADCDMGTTDVNDDKLFKTNTLSPSLKLVSGDENVATVFKSGDKEGNETSS